MCKCLAFSMARKAKVPMLGVGRLEDVGRPIVGRPQRLIFLQELNCYLVLPCSNKGLIRYTKKFCSEGILDCESHSGLSGRRHGEGTIGPMQDLKVLAVHKAISSYHISGREVSRRVAV
ncbi:hypothetical protein NHX12_009852 [Muraenolepis orangiensis]|uniref:Uncharacterized protein n=1 Tax=Muraenolepis orangiensis TaxID=630683 RepID=A0A9Q0I6R3_9TELE|nr:hypothetical protein NHX12_009852 [Muraenolepis orangiensis]